MKSILAMAIAAGALLSVHSCAHAQVQPDDVAFAKNNAAGLTLALSSQPCPMRGFWFWHMETAEGITQATGCWTLATHRRVLVMDRGEPVYIPYSRFSGNPNFGE